MFSSWVSKQNNNHNKRKVANIGIQRKSNKKKKVPKTLKDFLS